MTKLAVLQSLWAMEGLRDGGHQPGSLEDVLRLIQEANFAGVSTYNMDRDYLRRLTEITKAHGLAIECQAFPRTIGDLEPMVDLAAEFGIDYLAVQPNVRPRRVSDGVKLLEGWQRLSERAGVPVWIETHRNRMTTDLLFTLDLLDAFPNLRFVADLSHIVVGQEFAWPVTDEQHRMVERILDNAWAFHGRIATSEQVQIEIGYPQHAPWVDLFLSWWDYGFKSFRRRAEPDSPLFFVCELGPKPYAITGPDGRDTIDRWSESLRLKTLVESLYAESIDA